MHDSLFTYISQFHPLPLAPEEETLIREVFQLKKFRKNQFFLEEGSICDSIGFILKGSMRQYQIDEKSTEQTLNLYIENYWVSDRESSAMMTPSKYFIEAWEPTEMLVTSRKEFIELMHKSSVFSAMMRQLDERSAIASQRRINSAISNSAEKRYEEFAQNHPHFIQRFPLRIIASYLGVTKETLSRIRKNTKN